MEYETGEPVGERGRLTREAFLRRSAIMGLSLSGIAVVACGSDSGGSSTVAASGGKPPATPTGTFKVALGTPPITLDPARAGTEGDTLLVAQMYDGLVRYDDDYRAFAPALATSWSVSPDAREFEFKLRPDVRFQDGEPLDSTAVRKSLEYYRGETGSLLSLLVPPIDKIDDSDPLTLRVTTKASAPDFLRYQTFLKTISPAAAAKGAAALAKQPVGSGAYRFVSSGPSGVVLEAFPDHWGPGPYFERMEFPIIKDSTSQIDALRTGQISLVQRVPPPQARRLAQGGGGDVQTVTGDSWVVTYMTLQVNKEPFTDERVRQAFAHAIDKDAIVKAVLLDQAEVTDSLLPKGTYGYQDVPRMYAYDPDRARALLQQAGAEGARVRIAANTASVESDRLSQAVAGQLRDAGFDAQATLIPDLATWQKDISKRVAGHEVFSNNFLYVSGGPLIPSLGIVAINSKYTGRDLVDVVAKMNSTADGPAREAVIADLERINAEQVLLYPLAQLKVTDALGADIRGYVQARDGTTPRLSTTFRAV